MSENRALVTVPGGPSPALVTAVETWADVTTDAESARRADLRRDKTRAVLGFFARAGVPPEQVTPMDVAAWRSDLEERGLAPATVYAMVSRVSSFYRWAMSDGRVASNPVNLARPKAPKAYQSESTQALADEDVRALVDVVKAKADAGELVGKRDYALLLFYLATGMRRSEVITLRWGDVSFNGVMTVTGKVKGGLYRTRELQDTRTHDALLDYLVASGRLASMTADAPLWTRHDRAGQPGKPLTGRAFANNLKR